jgi:hypothetical protein
MKSVTPNFKNISKSFLKEEANEPEHKKSLKKYKKPTIKFGGK